MKNLFSIFIAIALLLFSSVNLFAFTQLHKYKAFHLSDIVGNIEKSKMIVSPFIKKKNYFNALDSYQWSSLESSVADFHRANLPHYVSVEKVTPTDATRALEQYGVEKSRYLHKVKNHYFCEGETIAFKFSDGKISIKLNTLKITDHETPNLNWTHYKDFASLKMNVDKSSECVFNQNGKLIEAWKVSYKENGFPYEIIVDANNQILKKSSKFLNINAMISSYLRNEIEDEGIVTDQIVDVDPDFEGLLRNENFNSKPIDEVGVSNDNFEYIYDPVTQRRSFEEATAFLHANVQLEYFEDNGYLWEGPRPMTIAIHGIGGFPEPTPDYAGFFPGSNTIDGRPVILIGDGTGEIFKNLPIDRDVVSHELGHHVIYRTVTDLETSDSILVHEAFSDYFALDATGNSCLGESICADNSGVNCWIGSSSILYDTLCLRSAETNLTIENAPAPVHLASQVISGMLWDLRRSETDTRVSGIHGHGLDPAEIRPIVHHAIDFMSYSTGIRDFIIALLEADKAVNGGSIISAKVYQAAINRGFESFMDGIDCSDSECDLENLPTTSPGTTPITNSGTISQGVQEDENSSGCGTVSEAAVGQFNFTFLLVLLLPLFISMLNKREN